MNQRSLEGEAPFTAAVISGLLAAALTWAWLENQQLLLVLVPLAIAAVFVLRFHPAAFVAGILTNLLFASAGRTDTMVTVSIAIAVGILWEIGASVVDGSLTSSGVRQRSTPTQNSLFAAVGILLSLLLHMRLCNEYGYQFSAADIGESFLGFLDCIFKIWLTPLARTETTFFESQDNVLAMALDPSNLNAAYLAMFANGTVTWEGLQPIVSSIIRALILSPLTWAAIFAALRQIGFRIWNVPLLLRQSWRAYLVGQTSFFVAILLLLLLVPIAFLPIDLQGVALLGWFSLSYFNYIRRVGRGAQRGL